MHPDLAGLHFIEIETSSQCNRACSWCPTGLSVERHSTQHLMTWERFTAIVGELGELGFDGWIALHNFNEPLLNTRLVDEYRAIVEHAPTAVPTLFTNGDKLTMTGLRTLIAAGVRHVRITRYPIKRRDGTNVGTDVSAWMKTSGLFELDWKKLTSRRGTEYIAESSGTTVQIVDPDVSRYTDRGGTVAIAEPRRRMDACNLTSSSAAIDRAGRLKMCCNVFDVRAGDENYIVGQIPERRFLELWGSAKMTTWREDHLRALWSQTPMCETCTLSVRDHPAG